jgi:outer membrane protein assembly factor BamB
MRNSVAHLFVIVTLAPLGTNAQADDWPQWRGLQRDAICHEQGLLETFPASGAKVRWRVPIGPGHASPIVAKGRVYVVDAELAKPQAWEQIHCFDENSGEHLWTHREEVKIAAGFFEEGTKLHPCSTPLVTDGMLVMLTSTGTVVCLDAATGVMIWKKDIGQDSRLAQLAEVTTCPLVEGGFVIIAIGGKPGGCVVALDLRTGEEAWRALDDPCTFSSPIVVTAGGQRQFIVWTPKAVTSLDPHTGKVWWREALSTGEDYTAATPVCTGELLLISGLMLRLQSERPGATIVWPETRSVSRRVLSNVCVPAILGDAVYGGKMNGHLVGLDAHSGEALWETDRVTDTSSGATIHLIVNGGSVWIFTNEGNLIHARLTRAGYEEMSRAHLIDPTMMIGGRLVVWAPPAIANGSIFARNDKELLSAALK